MAYQSNDKSRGARAWLEAGWQLVAPAPKMQRRAVRRIRQGRGLEDAWGDPYGRPPGLLRIAVLAIVAALTFAYQLLSLSDKIR